MSAPTPVRTALPSYRVAAAELPQATQVGDGWRAAVVVLAGGGDWSLAVRDAANAGAGAVIVDEPARASAADLAALRDLPLPIVVSRARLRPDVVADATEQDIATRAVGVDAGAPAAEFDEVLRDAVGWARVLARTPLTVASGRANERGVSALLVGPPRSASAAEGSVDGTPPPVCSLTIGRVDLDAGSGWLRIDALAGTRTEVVVDAAIGGSLVVTTDTAGRRESPRRYETAERLALRRALVALRDRSRVPDIADLAHDAALATALLSHRRG